MKNLLLFTSLILICSCTPTDTDQLTPGTWTGYLSPMNHPEMKNEVSYNVQYVENGLQIELIGPGGAPYPNRNSTDEKWLPFLFLWWTWRRCDLELHARQKRIGFFWGTVHWSFREMGLLFNGTTWNSITFKYRRVLMFNSLPHLLSSRLNFP